MKEHLARFGKSLDEDQLDQVVSPFSAEASFQRLLAGHREPLTLENCTARLDGALRGVGVALEGPDLESLGKRCFPALVERPRRDPKPPPSGGGPGGAPPAPSPEAGSEGPGSPPSGDGP